MEHGETYPQQEAFEVLRTYPSRFSGTDPRENFVADHLDNKTVARIYRRYSFRTASASFLNSFSASVWLVYKPAANLTFVMARIR